jgi:hypothetical protein
VAIAAAWQLSTVVTTTVNTFYTVPSAGTAPYGAYARDLVVNNGGGNTLFITMNPSSTTCTSAASFAIPPGGSVILTQCQVPAASVIGVACAGTLSTLANIGFGTNVSYI